MTDKHNSDKITFGQYGRVFQEKVVQAMLNDHRWAEQMSEVIDVTYFELKYLTFLADRFFSYSKKYKVFPTLELLVTIIRDDLKTGTDIVLRDQIVEYLQRVSTNPSPGDIAFVKEKSLDFCRKQALKKAFVSAIEMMETEKYESIVDLMKHAVSIGTTPSLGHDFFEDFEARFALVSRRCVPTGIAELDKKTILDGGLGAGELGVCIAATGVGKCVCRDSYVHIKYEEIVINGKLYDPWDKVATQRGLIYARDIIETDELV